MATNREQLEEAKIIKPDAELNQDQEDAIAELTQAEIDYLISAKDKLSGAFPAPEGTDAAPIGIIEHHH